MSGDTPDAPRERGRTRRCSQGDPRGRPGPRPESRPPATSTEEDTQRTTRSDAPMNGACRPESRHTTAAYRRAATRAPAQSPTPGSDGSRSSSRRPSAPPHRTPGPTDPALRANPYPEVTDLICRLPLSTLFQHARGCSPRRPAADMGTAWREIYTFSPGFSRASESSPDASGTETLSRARAPISG